MNFAGGRCGLDVWVIALVELYSLKGEESANHVIAREIPMVLHLYSTRLPGGRCLQLAQAIERVTKSSRSTHIAEELFAGKHPHGNEVALNVSHEEGLEELKALCSQCGIAVNTENGERE